MSQPGESQGLGRVKQIAGYTLESKLGQGGMGVVFKATDATIHRTVALKVLPAKFSQNQRFVARFLREARSAGRLQHPNIVKAYDAGQAPEGFYFFAMEFVDGESLMQRIKRQGALPEKEAVEIILGVAQGLAHAETTGMVHRDIKPDNILIDREGTPKITDFGLAKTEEDPTVTQAGGIVGSPQYMSPEQARGEQTLDIRTDIYSLGATFFHAVVGVPPFRGENAGVVINMVLKEPPPTPQEQNPAISEATSKVILKMLAKDSSSRYVNTAALIGDLEKLQRGEPPSVLAAGRFTKLPDRRREAILERDIPEKKKSPVLLYVAAGLALAAIGLAAAVLMKGKMQASPPPEPAVSKTPTTSSVTAAVKAPEEKATPTSAVQAAATLEMREKEAAAALEQAASYLATHADDFKGQIQEYQSLAQRFPDTQAAAKALEATATIESEMENRAGAALESLQQEARPLLAEKKYGDALNVMDRFPENLRNDKWVKEIETQKANWQNEAASTFKGVLEKASKLADAGQFDEAKKQLEPALGFGIPSIASQAEAALARWEEQAEKARAEAEEKNAKLIRELMEGLKSQLESRDYRKASEWLGQKVQDDFSPQALAAAQGMKAAVAKLDEFWSAVEKGAGKLKPGESISLKGTSGKFTSFTEGKIYIDIGGPQTNQKLTELKSRELASLAQKALDPNAGETHLQFALFYIADRERDAETARQHLEAASKAGADVQIYRDFFDWMDKGETESEAQALMKKAKTFLAKKDWKKSNDAVQKLKKEFTETRFVKENADALTAHLVEVDKVIAQEADPLFAKATNQFNKGQIKECRETIERMRKEYAGTGYLAQAQAKIDNLVGLIAQQEGAEALKKVKAVGPGGGFIEEWYMIGPFDNPNKEGFEKEYPPEQKVNLKQSYSGQDGKKVGWKLARKPNTPGMMDLRDNIAPISDAVAYAYTAVESPVDLEVVALGGSDDTMTVWINGEKVLEKAKWYGQCTADEHVGKARLVKGKNNILIKVCQGSDDPRWPNGWAFYFRLCDAEGKPIVLKSQLK